MKSFYEVIEELAEKEPIKLECVERPPNPRIANFSPIKEGEDQIDNGSDTYYTRETGRTANTIYEYVYWRLRAKQDGKNFRCTYDDFLFESSDMYVEKTEKEDKGITTLEPYPFNANYYIDHRDEIIDMLGYKQPEKKYDMVIHLRLDDVLNDCDGYTLIPLSEYVNLFKKHNLHPRHVTIIGKCIDQVQKEYVNCLENIIKYLLPQCKVEQQLYNTIKTDMEIIGGCDTFIASTSTFWFWSMFLSDNIQACYYPDWGVCKKMNLERITWCVPFAGEMHPMKIKAGDLHRIFL